MFQCTPVELNFEESDRTILRKRNLVCLMDIEHNSLYEHSLPCLQTSDL